MPAFRPFSFEHWVVLLLTLAAIFALLANAKRIRAAGDDRILRWSIAAGLVINATVALLFYFHLGILKIPLQLCDLALFLMALAMIIESRFIGELAFFWGLAGSSQAVLTPDLWTGFPSFQCCQFFLSHCAVILSAVYLAAKGRFRFSGGSVWRVWIATNLYVGVVGFINWRYGLNFGYVAAKPDHPSVLDLFGPWPYYIIGGEFLALGLFTLCYVFARGVDLLSRK